MPGLDSLPNWEDARETIADMAVIHGLTDEELKDLETKIHAHIAGQTDLVKQAQMVAQVKEVALTAADGTLKTALFSLLGI